MGGGKNIAVLFSAANKEIETKSANKRKKNLDMAHRMFFFCIFAII